MEEYGCDDEGPQSIAKQCASIHEQALAAPLATASDYAEVHLAYCEFLRRQLQRAVGNVDNLGSDEAERGGQGQQDLVTAAASALRHAFETADAHLQASCRAQPDPDGRLIRLWASIAARSRSFGGLGEPEKARQLWETVVSPASENKLGTMSRYWLEYVNVERRIGLTAAARKGKRWDDAYVGRIHSLFSRALKATQDDPGGICLAWLQWEREEGSAKSRQIAEACCRSKYKELQNIECNVGLSSNARDTHTAMSADLESTISSNGNEPQLRKRKQVDSGDASSDLTCSHEVAAARIPVVSQPSSAKRQKLDKRARRAVREARAACDFRLPESKQENTGRNADCSSVGRAQLQRKQKSEENEKTNAGKEKMDSSRTVVVKNLPFTVEEPTLANFFETVVAASRVVRAIVALRPGTSKPRGIGYVAFEDPSSVALALALPNEQRNLEGREVEVVRYNVGAAIETQNAAKARHKSTATDLRLKGSAPRSHARGRVALLGVPRALRGRAIASVKNSMQVNEPAKNVDNSAKESDHHSALPGASKSNSDFAIMFKQASAAVATGTSAEDDINVQCKDCKDYFVFTVGEQAFFKDKGWVQTPNRCKNCRKAKKQKHF
eukprot:SAG31_NODE_3005_length_4795_cov_2.671210_2_plen_613_part_00